MNITGLAMLAGCLALSYPADARLGWYPDYDELAKKCNVIVIARDIAVRELSETSGLPDFIPPKKVVGVETTFKVVTVLKGEMTGTTFVLHHYRFPTTSAAKDMVEVNGTSMVTFLGNKQRYLMFLNKESDGRYAPASGQTDPYLSIRPLSDDNTHAFLVPIFRCLLFWISLVVVLPVVLLVCGLIYQKKRRKLNKSVQPTADRSAVSGG